jgi:hypothetical protein
MDGLVGHKMAAFLFAICYAAMVGVGYVIEFVFGALHLIPQVRNAIVLDAGVSWNYTTYLNIVFILLALALIRRCLKAAGPMMLTMMREG